MQPTLNKDLLFDSLLFCESDLVESVLCRLCVCCVCVRDVCVMCAQEFRMNTHVQLLQYTLSSATLFFQHYLTEK